MFSVRTACKVVWNPPAAWYYSHCCVFVLLYLVDGWKIRSQQSTVPLRFAAIGRYRSLVLVYWLLHLGSKTAHKGKQGKVHTLTSCTWCNLVYHDYKVPMPYFNIKFNHLRGGAQPTIPNRYATNRSRNLPSCASDITMRVALLALQVVLLAPTIALCPSSIADHETSRTYTRSHSAQHWTQPKAPLMWSHHGLYRSMDST